MDKGRKGKGRGDIIYSQNIDNHYFTQRNKFFHKKNVRIKKKCIFAVGKSYTTSSHQTPPGSEGSKGRWLSGAI